MISKKRFGVFLFKIFALILVAIGIASFVQSAMRELHREDVSILSLHPFWILASLLFCTMGLVAWGSFWRSALSQFGHPLPVAPVLGSYFLGHLGKYVPGKAMVILLRSSSLLRYHVPISVSVVSVFLETLIMMASGSTLGGIALSLHNASTSMVGMALLFALLAATPTAPPLMKRCLTWIAQRRKGVLNFAFLIGLDWKLIAVGWGKSSLGWLLTIVSLWCLLRGILPTESNRSLFDSELWLACGSAATLSVVAGFVSMLPGGAGVREYILLLSLAPIIGNGPALVAAVGMRLVSLASETIGYVLFTWASHRNLSTKYNGASPH